MTITTLVAVLCGSLWQFIPSNKNHVEKSSNGDDDVLQPNQTASPERPLTETDNDMIEKTPKANVTAEIKLYRQAELSRIKASLLANSSLLVVGKEGSGKSTLAMAVVSDLEKDGFTVVFVEPSRPKQMLLDICNSLNIPTESLEGKSLSIEELKYSITNYLENNTTFLIIDDAHICDNKFRMWLKQLRRKTPLLVLANNPRRNDIFINIPRIELKPLPEYAIREIMIQATIDREIVLKPSELAKLQERVGGNPMLAIRAVEEEYLGLEFEGADHNRYFDITPFILFAGIIFMVMKFIGVGMNDQSLYIFSSILASIFLGLSRLLYKLPRESQRL
ncbi:AAA family ATPase [Rivularia sp. UHCC 0363]|uniref:AAA family ATPase n=1 Tax=Rivularia sp. UHCC 0363 TaxID=3110244 RepID=UPI002B1F3A2C|nr:AAA family ATPase [Rivularia sp. UHCC 0363]MEA5595709.1 AAA family ATPase [Rivularia sp. UHCC 0363]